MPSRWPARALPLIVIQRHSAIMRVDPVKRRERRRAVRWSGFRRRGAGRRVF
jgi:hypothetical protein